MHAAAGAPSGRATSLCSWWMPPVVGMTTVGDACRRIHTLCILQTMTGMDSVAHVVLLSGFRSGAFGVLAPAKGRQTCALLPAAQDVARVARWMAGKAVGLVLSGGGSRGLAHLGVLHALDDAGVPIDVIGGTSQARARDPVRVFATVSTSRCHKRTSLAL